MTARSSVRMAWLALVALAACSDDGGDSGATDGSGDGADATDATPVDADGDGVSTADGDCDDGDPLVFPGAEERCNGIDDDCDGAPHPREGAGGGDCAACEAGGWWPVARSDARGADLRAALAEGLSGTACTDYDTARDRLFQVDADSDGVVTCVYTGRTFSIQGGVDYDAVNPEHAWPRADGADGEPRECDLHHLFVSDAPANSRRGNHPYGLPTSVDWEDGGSELGTDGSGERVFAPRAASRGDIARAMLYFGLRYAGDLGSGSLDKHDRPTLYRSWHEDDPPDRDEQQRSVDLSRAQSGPANPFVVCPWMVGALLDAPD